MSAWPNLLIVGAQKAGTTSLWKTLDRHPDVFMCRPKEPRYFSDYMRGFWPAVTDRDEYLALFASAGDARYRGEGSTSYLCDPDTPEKIKAATGGDTRILVSLRDPVERAYSAFLHQQRNGIRTGTFLESIEDEIADRSQHRVSLLQHGRYAEPLERYVAAFGRDHVHIVIFEQLVAAPEAELAHLLDWLDLDQIEGGLQLGSTNRYREPRGAVAGRVLMAPRLRRAVRRVVPHGLRSRGERLLSRSGVKPEIDPRARALLQQVYAEERAALEAVTGPLPWPSSTG